MSLPDRIPEDYAEFILSTVVALVKRGCLVKLADVSGSTCPARHVGKLVSCSGDSILLDIKCHQQQWMIQRYFGIMCNTTTIPSRALGDNLQKVHSFIRTVLEKGALTVNMLETTTKTRLSVFFAIRPASLWTQYMFAAVVNTKRRELQVCQSPDQREELHIWLGLSATIQESPWY